MTDSLSQTNRELSGRSRKKSTSLKQSFKIVRIIISRRLIRCNRPSMLNRSRRIRSRTRLDVDGQGGAERRGGGSGSQKGARSNRWPATVSHIPMSDRKASLIRRRKEGADPGPSQETVEIREECRSRLTGRCSGRAWSIRFGPCWIRW
jgi:hypothetical protein